MAVNHYTSCLSSSGVPITSPEGNIACPVTRRSTQIDCTSIATTYICPGDGSRLRWITNPKCTTTSITIPEDSPTHDIPGTQVVQFVGYNSMAIKYSFGRVGRWGDTSLLTTCQRYFWDRMDQNYFEQTGGIKLKIGQIVDYENSNGCITTPIEVRAVPAHPDCQNHWPAYCKYTSETCTLQLSIGDVNDAPIWSMWSFSVNVEEDVPPRTVIGTFFFFLSFFFLVTRIF